MNENKKYRLRLTALTPIHIGIGEHYEPTNFVVDDKFLYEFDEYTFFQMLDSQEKQKFVKAAEKSSIDSLFEIHKFIKMHKETAKKAAKHKVQVSSGIQEDYEDKNGKVVQVEGGKKTDKRKVFNKFEIEKTIRRRNDRRVYIPGSSIKGAISTAYQEMIFKKDRTLWENLFYNRNPSKNLFKEVSVADSMPIKTYSMVGYALNKERFEEDDQGPSIKLEVIYSSIKQQSVFETTINLKKFFDLDYEVTMDEIRKACNDHYLPIFKQQFKEYAMFQGKKVEEYTNEYFSDEFYEKYRSFMPKENQFLLRVGRYSQARAVTIDGLRRIKVKISGGGPRRKPNTYDQETTAWLFGFKEDQQMGLYPFGWVLCEIIEG